MAVSCLGTFDRNIHLASSSTVSLIHSSSSRLALPLPESTVPALHDTMLRPFSWLSSRFLLNGCLMNRYWWNSHFQEEQQYLQISTISRLVFRVFLFDLQEIRHVMKYSAEPPSRWSKFPVLSCILHKYLLLAPSATRNPTWFHSFGVRHWRMTTLRIAT